tara:strand:+ start:5814 stop:6518 length:705 start_codon:yes stop_codon:yes gene_type:complete
MEKIQESIQNSFKEIFSGNVSPRTIQTRLKENIDKLTSETIENTNISVDDTVNISESVSEKMTSVGFSKWNIFKIILAILIIGLLAINAYTYITYGKDAFTFFLVNDNSNEILDKRGDEEPSKESSKEPSKESNEVPDDKATTAIHSSIDIEAKKLSKKEKVDESDIERALKKNNKNSYKANNLSNNVNKKVGYCYIGADRNVRTCVKVGENDTCMSGEVFPTMDLCINPNLKE